MFFSERQFEITSGHASQPNGDETLLSFSEPVRHKRTYTGEKPFVWFSGLEFEHLPKLLTCLFFKFVKVLFWKEW